MEFNKESALDYIRSDIAALAEQSEENGIRGYEGRVRGEIGLLMTLSLISTDEAERLEGEMVNKRTLASNRIGK